MYKTNQAESEVHATYYLYPSEVVRCSPLTRDRTVDIQIRYCICVTRTRKKETGSKTML